MSTLKTNNIQHVDRSDPSIIINTDGGVSIAGTLTYEDVTSVDAVGIVTAREILNAQKQVHVGTGVGVKAGGINVTAGITTVQALQATSGTFSAAVSGTTGAFTDDVTVTGDKLKVFNASAPQIRINSDTSDGSSTRLTIGRATGSNNFVNGSASGDSAITFPSNLIFGVETAEKMRLDSSGRLLLGTTTEGESTADDLTIANTGSGGITIRSGTSGEGNIFFSDGTSGTAEYEGTIQYNHGSNYMLFFTNHEERIRIDSSGKFLIGHTSPIAIGPASATNMPLQVIGDSYATSGMTLSRFSADANGSHIHLVKSRNATKGSQTVVQVDDTLGFIGFYGSDGTDTLNRAASVEAICDAPPASNKIPGRLEFRTTESLTYPVTRLTINSAGNSQFTGIVTATEFVPTVSQFSHRNLVINGDFRIAQRGTSATTASAMSTVDRWFMLANGVDENPTQSQVDVASGTTPYSQGLRKAFRITNGNQTSIEAADFIGYKYVFEAQDIATSGWNYTSSSSFITLSFWIKTSVTNVSTANLRTYDASPVRSFKFDISTTANTWKKVELKVPGNSNLVFDNNTSAGLVFHLYTYLGTTYRDNDTNTETWIDGSATNTYGNNNVTNTWWNQNDATVEITGVQLEVGSQATPFEHRSYQDELHRCKRYYQRYPEGPHADNYVCVPSAVMVCNNTTTAYYCPTLNPTMRTSPTFSSSGNFRVNGTASVNNVAVTAIGLYHNGAATPFQYATVASGLTAGEAIAMSVYNDANAYIAYDAEL